MLSRNVRQEPRQGLCSDLGSGPPGPRSILKGKKEGSEERGARNCLRDTPFSFMLRGFRSDFPLERDLPRIPETLEEVSGNRALRNFARKVFGMIFSMVFVMFYVMCSGMSLGMVFGMIFGTIRSNFGMFCSMFGSMFCSMFVNMFLSMFGWMVKEVVMIQCGGAASILEIAALRGSLFIPSLAGFVCLLLLGPWAFPRVAVAATAPATNVARCAAERPACAESSGIATITAGLASTVGLANAGWRITTGWGRLMFKIFLGGRFWSSRKIDLEGLSSPGRRGSVPRVEPLVKSCMLLGEDRQILKAFRGPLVEGSETRDGVERKRTELIGSLYQRYRGPPRKQHVTRNVPCHVGMLRMLLLGMISGVHASAASFSGPTCDDNDGCKHGRGRVHPNFDGGGFTPGLSTKRAPWVREWNAGPLLCWRSPAFSPEDGFGPDALNAQPRSNPPAPPSAPPQPVPSPTPGVDPSPEEGDDWGPEWPGEAPSKRLRSAGAASGSEAPAYGIPGNVPAGSLSPPLGGVSFQEQLWIRALKAESDRRWKEAEEVGIGPFPHPVDEPRPLLSHFYGIPERRLAQAQRRAVARRHVLLAKFFALLRSRTTLPQPCPTFSQFSELSLRPRALVL